MTAVGLSKKLNISQSTASEAVMRDRVIVEEKGLRLIDDEGIGESE